MISEPSNYHAFLLRLWREPGQAPWRASLEDPHTGERKLFAETDSLLDYLRQLAGEPAPGAPPSPVTPLGQPPGAAAP